jgi:hypothetical protein
VVKAWNPNTQSYMEVEPEYVCRWIKPEHQGEIVQAYHAARMALSDKPYAEQSPYHRMLWASAQFHKTHPEVSETAAYKDLCGLLGR